MTANELIETAEKAKTQEYGHTDDWIKNASILLRQQQSEIEALKLRELSDEEVDKILKQHDWYNKSWVDMVRSIESAILKKAREK